MIQEFSYTIEAKYYISRIQPATPTPPRIRYYQNFGTPNSMVLRPLVVYKNQQAIYGGIHQDRNVPIRRQDRPNPSRLNRRRPTRTTKKPLRIEDEFPVLY